MTPAKFSSPAPALAAYWSVVVVAFIALRVNHSDVQLNIDELIPVKVSEAMSARGVLDPNWRFGDLPWFWNADQYNFYLYNIVAHAVLKAGAWFGMSALPALRLANVVLQLFAFAFALDALRRIGAGRFALAFAGALLAVAPGVVQDAGMARPESLLYLLVALQIWILTLKLPERWAALLFGLLLGAGMAVKVSYVLAVVMIAVPWLISWRERGLRRLLLLGTIVAVGAAGGFAVCAPYALIYPGVFLRGLASLRQQYEGGQPPHALPSCSVVSQALWISRYFAELYGVVPLVALAAPFLLKGRERIAAIAFVAPLVVLFVYFTGKATFYERNFSFALIPMLLAVALAVSVLRSWHWRAAVAAILLLPMIYWAAQIAISTNDRDAVMRFEAAHGVSPSHRMWFHDVEAKEVPPGCNVLAVIDYNDPWTLQYLAMLQAEGFVPLARYRSRFGWLATATLQTYLDTDWHYFRCPEARYQSGIAD